MYKNADSSFIQNNLKWETTQRPSKGEWINNRWFIHSEDYIKIKRSKILIHAIKWVNFTDIMLKESSPTERSTNCMITFIISSPTGKNNPW